MKFPTKIITDEKKLILPCDNYCRAEFKEALELGQHLLKVCKDNEGLGLAAIQLGILRRVCVVNVIEPLIIINPSIVWRTLSTIAVEEGCLSFPGKLVTTRRPKKIKIARINEKLEPEYKEFGSIDIKEKQQEKILECVCVCHEIAHCDSQTIFDYAIGLEDTEDF